MQLQLHSQRVPVHRSGAMCAPTHVRDVYAQCLSLFSTKICADPSSGSSHCLVRHVRRVTAARLVRAWSVLSTCAWSPCRRARFVQLLQRRVLHPPHRHLHRRLPLHGRPGLLCAPTASPWCTTFYVHGCALQVSCSSSATLPCIWCFSRWFQIPRGDEQPRHGIADAQLCARTKEW